MDLAPRLRSHILGDALNALGRGRLDYVRKVVYEPHGGRYLQALEEKERGRAQNGNQFCRRGEANQNRGKDLLSLDFMVWQEVYLADDSHSSQPRQHRRHPRAQPRVHSHKRINKALP